MKDRQALVDVESKDIKRFTEKVERKPNGCWLWTAAKNRKGYGQFRYKGTLYIAHRFSFEYYKKESLRDLHIMHTCDTPSCVNPKHLKAGTNQDNVDDKMAKKRDKKNTITHCKNGHEFTEDNTRIRKSDNSRQCRTCERKNCSDYYWNRGGKAKRQTYDKLRRS